MRTRELESFCRLLNKAIGMEDDHTPATDEDMIEFAKKYGDEIEMRNFLTRGRFIEYLANKIA